MFHDLLPLLAATIFYSIFRVLFRAQSWFAARAWLRDHPPPLLKAQSHCVRWWMIVASKTRYKRLDFREIACEVAVPSISDFMFLTSFSLQGARRGRRSSCLRGKSTMGRILDGLDWSDLENSPLSVPIRAGAWRWVIARQPTDRKLCSFLIPKGSTVHTTKSRSSGMDSWSIY